jgi:hypothetical protein
MKGEEMEEKIKIQYRDNDLIEFVQGILIKETETHITIKTYRGGYFTIKKTYADWILRDKITI